MKKYLVEYALDYQHIVRVGVTADSARKAKAAAQKAFDAGTIWDDTFEMPLLYDDFEETDDNVLEFDVTEVGEFPLVDPSVMASKSRVRLAIALDLLERVRPCDMDGALRRDITKFLDD